MKTTTPPIISLPRCGFSDEQGNCLPDNKKCTDPMRCTGYTRPVSTEEYARLQFTVETHDTGKATIE